MAQELSQQEVEQWIAEHGGPGNVQYVTEPIEIDNPVLDPNSPDYDKVAAGAGLVPPKVKVNSEKWVTKDGTKASLQIYRTSDGTIRQHASDTGTAPPKEKPTVVSAGTTDPYIVRQMPDGTIKTEPNPNYQGPKPKDAHVTTFNGDLIQVNPDGTVVTLRKGTQQDKQAVINGVLWEKNAQTGQWEQKAGADRVTVGGQVYEKNPKTGQYTVVVDARTPTRYTIKDQVYEVTADEAGKPTLRRIPKQGERPLPARWAGWQPDPSKADGGYGDRSKAVLAAAEAGELTPDEAQQILETDQAAVKASREYQRDQEAIREHDVGTATTERAQDISQADARLSAATSGFQTALSTTAEGNKYLPHGSDLGYRAFEAMLGMQRQHASDMGGLATPARTDPGRPYAGPSGPGNLVGTPTGGVNVVGAAGAAPPPPPGPPNPLAQAGALANQAAVSASQASGLPVAGPPPPPGAMPGAAGPLPPVPPDQVPAPPDAMAGGGGLSLAMQSLTPPPTQPGAVQPVIGAADVEQMLINLGIHPQAVLAARDVFS